MKFRSSLDNLISRAVRNINGMFSRNGGRSLINLFERLGRTVVTTNKSWIRCYKAYAVFCYKLYREGGSRYLTIYLKASSVLLQQAVGGQNDTNPRLLGAAVSRTSSGLPRVIPALMRKRIMNRETRVIKLWLSLFNLYRIIECPHKLKLSTITDPGKTDIGPLLESMKPFIGGFLASLKALSGLTELPLSESNLAALKAEPFIIPKSSPAIEGRESAVPPQFNPSKDELTWGSTSPLAIYKSAGLLRTDEVLWPVISKWCSLTGNHWVVEKIELWTKDFNFDALRGHVGRVGFKKEPAGKVRVFAMVDCWTQWLLKPLHLAIFSLLKKIPQDGTFDQHRPVHRLLMEMEDRGHKEVYSYDLSAATDRLPIALQELLLGPLLGSELSALWRALLTFRGYKARNKEFGVNTTLYYAVGQPMGALSSWAMLALTHHFIVQYAASLTREGTAFIWFRSYAVLGDDIVISDRKVAKKYFEVMSALGVEIGLAKSLESSKRTLEFAKKYFVPQDASPIPFKELLSAEHNSSALMEYVRKFNLRIPDALHLMGFGWKVKSALHKGLWEMGARARRIIVMLTSPDGPFGRELREWLVMHSLVKNQDHDEWDREICSFIAVEIPILKRRVNQLEKLLLPWDDCARGAGAEYLTYIWDQNMVDMTLESIYNPDTYVNSLFKDCAWRPESKKIWDANQISSWERNWVDTVDTIYGPNMTSIWRSVKGLSNAVRQLEHRTEKVSSASLEEVDLYFLEEREPVEDLFGLLQALWMKVDQIEDELSHVSLRQGKGWYREGVKTFLDPAVNLSKRWVRLTSRLRSKT